MNALIQTIASHLEHAALTAPLFDAALKSVVVLAAAGGLCLLLPRAAAATRHWVWFLAVANLPCLLLLSCVPLNWHRPIWSVSAGSAVGNEISLTLTLAPAAGAATRLQPGLASGAGHGKDDQRAGFPRRPIYRRSGQRHGDGRCRCDLVLRHLAGVDVPAGWPHQAD